MILMPTNCPGCGSAVERFKMPEGMNLRGVGYACGTAITESQTDKSVVGPCVAKLVSTAIAIQGIKTLIKHAESVSGKIPTMEDEL